MAATPPSRVPEGAQPDPAFIGHGIRFPMSVDSRGSIALGSGADGLDSSIRVVLATAPSERVMRPQFGCRIWDLLFEPVNANTLGLMAQAVREAVTQWEPRVAVHEVLVRPDEDDPSMVRIIVTYDVKTTNDRRNLVYPFYLIPREEG